MSISAKDVRKLREATGAGMMDCKKALQESGGDYDGAVDYLRKKGQKVAAKRADKDANEGVVVALTTSDNTKGVLVCVGCETDFVAKNDAFIEFATSIAQLALDNFPASNDELQKLPLDGATVGEKLVEQTGKMGEKIETSYEKVEGEKISSYVHAGSKIGVLVSFKDGDKDGGDKFFKGVAMHIAAMKPTVLSAADFEADFEKETESFISRIKVENEDRDRLGKPLKNVPQFVSKRQLTPEVMAKVETEIKEQLKTEGKPEKIWDKILPGKIDRFIADNTLLDQEHCLMSQFFALDDSKSVEQAIAEFGPDAEIKEFKRLAVG